MKKANITLTVFFLALIALPTLDWIFNLSPIKEIFEKRKMATMPEISYSKQYFSDLEKYFNDNYGFRKSLISLNIFMMDEVFDEVVDDRVAIGKDGWLYFDNYNSLADAQGLIKLDQLSLERTAKAFYNNWQQLKQRNIQYLLVIAADKSSIYPEFLPDYLITSINKSPTRADQLIEAIKNKYPDFPLLDLREILLDAKQKELIYHKTDTHWNQPGAHYGYLAIANYLGFKPNLRKEFALDYKNEFAGDISQLLGLDLKEKELKLRPKFKPSYNEEIIDSAKSKQFHLLKINSNKNQKLPRLFAYKDSFFGDLIPLLSQHFSRSVFVNEFPCNIDYKKIEEFKPNVMIQEFWEGRISGIIEECYI